MSDGLLSRVYKWCDHWLQPAIGAVYEKDVEKASEAYKRARESLKPEEFSVDELTAVDLYFLRVDYYIARMTHYPDRLKELFQRTVASYREPKLCGPASTVMFNRIMLELHIIADRDELIELDGDSFNELFVGIPPEERIANIWYMISPWLFKNREIDLLKEGYEVLLTSQVYLEQFPFRRMKLMYQLLTDTAREEDIIYYLQHLEIHNAFNEFKWFFKQTIEEKGLLTPAVNKAIDEAARRFAEELPKSPFKK